MACGRCGGVIEPEKFGDAVAGSCATCGGIAMKQGAMIPSLQVLAKAFAADMTYDKELPRTEPPTHAVACRTCSKPMTAFGYMETRICYAHRCATCWEVWIDAEQLPALLMLYARTNLRSEARRAAADHEAEGMSRRLRAQLSARLKSSAISLGVGVIG